MAIVFLGDIHGNFQALLHLNDVLDEEDVVVQVGDFGVWPDNMGFWKKHPLKFTTYFIDGNHEHYGMLPTRQEVAEFYPKLYFCPRGSTHTIGGLRFGFLGGAASVDKEYRRCGKDWWPEEDITDDDVNRLLKNVGEGSLDVLVTHTPGQKFINTFFPPLIKSAWGLPDSWQDTSSPRVDYVLERLRGRIGFHFCGHMHQSVFDGRTRCLDIAETYTHYTIPIL